VIVPTLLQELRSRDIRVWAEGDQLRCTAPTGVLTPELREQLRERKTDIVEFLRSAESLAQQQRGIVPLQPRGTRAPVFGVPGHNGDVFCYSSWVTISRSSGCSLRVPTVKASCLRASRIWPPTSPHRSVPTGPTMHMSLPASAPEARSHSSWRDNSCSRARPFVSSDCSQARIQRRSGGCRSSASASRVTRSGSVRTRVRSRRSQIGSVGSTSGKDCAITRRAVTPNRKLRPIRCRFSGPRLRPPRSPRSVATHLAISTAAWAYSYPTRNGCARAARCCVGKTWRARRIGMSGRTAVPVTRCCSSVTSLASPICFGAAAVSLDPDDRLRERPRSREPRRSRRQE